MNTLLETSIDKAGSTSTRWPTSPPNRILIVDDDVDLRQLNTQLLVLCGYEVNAAEDGEAAWEYLQANNCDLLITDNHLPRLSGLELVRKLRSANMSLPVILTSESVGTAGLSRNDQFQFAATLSKPFTNGELVDTVTKVLRAAASSRQSGGVYFPVLVEALRHIAPCSHWGINE